MDTAFMDVVAERLPSSDLQRPSDLSSAMQTSPQHGAAPALAAAREAVARHRALAQDGRHSPRLAEALDVLVNCLRAAGEHQEALEVAQEACLVHRELAARADRLQPETLVSPLQPGPGGSASEPLDGSLAGELPEPSALSQARAYEDLANQLLREPGRREEALAARQRAVQLLRELCVEQPALAAPELARALEALASSLTHRGQRESALSTLMEGVALRRRLAAASPQQHTRALAGALHKLAARLTELERHAESRAAMQECVVLARHLAQQQPQHRPLLASALQGLAESLRAAGETGLAADALHECADCHRALAPAEANGQRHSLAGALAALASLQHERREREAALVAAGEAVMLYTALAAGSAAYQHLLAKAVELQERCRAISV